MPLSQAGQGGRCPAAEARPRKRRGCLRCPAALKRGGRLLRRRRRRPSTPMERPCHWQLDGRTPGALASSFASVDRTRKSCSEEERRAEDLSSAPRRQRETRMEREISGERLERRKKKGEKTTTFSVSPKTATTQATSSCLSPFSRSHTPLFSPLFQLSSRPLTPHATTRRHAMGLTSAIAAFRRSSPTKEGAAAATLSTTTTSAATNGVHDSPPVNDIGGKVSFSAIAAIVSSRQCSASCREAEGREECSKWRN